MSTNTSGWCLQKHFYVQPLLGIDLTDACFEGVELDTNQTLLSTHILWSTETSDCGTSAGPDPSLDTTKPQSARIVYQGAAGLEGLQADARADVQLSLDPCKPSILCREGRALEELPGAV